MLVLLAAPVCWVYNGHNAGTRPAGKPASKTSKPEQPSSRAASKTSILLFLTGFRNYVRGFLGALLELLRVSSTAATSKNEPFPAANPHGNDGQASKVQLKSPQRNF